MFLCKTGSTFQITNPGRSEDAVATVSSSHMLNPKSSAPAWTHNGRISALVVGVMTNNIHKVLVNICMLVMYAWQPYMRRKHNHAHEHVINPRQHLLGQLERDTQKQMDY